MLMLVLNVLFVLVAISMIALILMQRGSGAQAGTGFGGGASATVFGSRGSSKFLSKATKWLAIVFFAISLFMAWHVTRTSQHGERKIKRLISMHSRVSRMRLSARQKTHN